VFLPVRSAGNELVDGGVTSVVPVRAARALGADIVIGVDIYCHGPRYRASSVFSMWLKVMQTQSCLLADAELAEADLVIAPSVAPAGLDDAAGRESARRLGYEAASAAVPALRTHLRHRASSNRQMERVIQTMHQPED
jgi:NTE family protein